MKPMESSVAFRMQKEFAVFIPSQDVSPVVHACRGCPSIRLAWSKDFERVELALQFWASPRPQSPDLVSFCQCATLVVINSKNYEEPRVLLAFDLRQNAVPNVDYDRAAVSL